MSLLFPMRHYTPTLAARDPQFSLNLAVGDDHGRICFCQTWTKMIRLL